MKPPIMDLPIEVAEGGFYKGFAPIVALTAKNLVGALIIWAIVFPEQAGNVLRTARDFTFNNFDFWYVIYQKIHATAKSISIAGQK